MTKQIIKVITSVLAVSVVLCSGCKNEREQLDQGKVTEEIKSNMNVDATTEVSDVETVLESEGEDVTDMVQENALLQEENTVYNNLIGTWNVETDGNITATFTKVKKNKVAMRLECVSAPPFDRIAYIEVFVSFDGNEGVFVFEDDGWGNSGIGTVQILDNKIHIKTEVTDMDEMAMWNIYSDYDFVKAEKADKNVDISELDLVYDDVKYIFGEQKTKRVVAEMENHIFKGITVQICGEEYEEKAGEIALFVIDYEQSDDKTRYSFKGINGNSTEDDVYKIFEKPSDIEEIDGKKYIEYEYIIASNSLQAVSFVFDETGALTHTIASVETTHRYKGAIWYKDLMESIT